ncbi:hypothetical protein GR157_04690 [Burkholderia sp. 4701]|nr:hypothetical protein [Burkholderia sp. 4701]MXN85443.1 hypothetical protein [Burkholderia sp. 4812]
MEQMLARWLHRPEPTMPDIDPDDPDSLDDDLPPDPTRPYRYPEGDRPGHPPPRREPPGGKPPVHAARAPGAGAMPCRVGRR